MKANQPDEFDKWLQTPKGQSCFKSRMLINPGANEVYMKNQLWWAFHAGAQSWDVQFSECGSILRDIESKYMHRLPKWLRNRIKYQLEENVKSNAKQLLTNINEK